MKRHNGGVPLCAVMFVLLVLLLHGCDTLTGPDDGFEGKPCEQVTGRDDMGSGTSRCRWWHGG